MLSERGGSGKWLDEVGHTARGNLCSYTDDCKGLLKESGSNCAQITSKLWNTHHHPENVEEAVNKTLSDLQTDYLDLYLVCFSNGLLLTLTDNARSTGRLRSNTPTRPLRP